MRRGRGSDRLAIGSNAEVQPPSGSSGVRHAGYRRDEEWRVAVAFTAKARPAHTLPIIDGIQGTTSCVRCVFDFRIPARHGTPPVSCCAGKTRILVAPQEKSTPPDVGVDATAKAAR